MAAILSELWAQDGGVMSDIEKLYNILVDIGDWSSDNLSEWSGNREWEEFGGSWAEVGDDEIEKLDSLINAAQFTAKNMVKNTCHNVAAPPENGFWPTPHFECSACGKYYVTSDYVYFCPSCGRRVIEDVQQEP